MTDYFLLDDQLTAMRADVARLLPLTGTLYARAYTNDGAGGGSISYTAMGTVQCRIDPALSSGRVDYTTGREGMLYEYICTLPYNAPIEKDYRLDVNGYSYEVKNLSNNHAWNVSKRAGVVRIG